MRTLITVLALAIRLAILALVAAAILAATGCAAPCPPRPAPMPLPMCPDGTSAVGLPVGVPCGAAHVYKMPDGIFLPPEGRPEACLGWPDGWSVIRGDWAHGYGRTVEEAARNAGVRDGR